MSGHVRSPPLAHNSAEDTAELILRNHDLLGRKETTRLALGIALAVFVSAPAEVAARALPPSTPYALQKVLQTVETCRIDGIGVEGYYAIAHLCLRDAPQSCFTVRLDDPIEGCNAEALGPWCVRWMEGEAPADVRDAVRAALRASSDPWVEIGPLDEHPVDVVEPSEAPLEIHARPLAIAVGLVAAPLLAGVMLVRALQRSAWRLPRLLGIAVALSLTSVGAALLQHLSLWDVVFSGILMISGVVFGAARADWRSILVFAVASASALAGLEVAVRRWLPPPPRFPPPEDASFIIKTADWDVGCAVLYGPEGVDRQIQHLRAAPDQRPRKAGPLVVHLGDSMTFGYGIREKDAFPALLNARDDRVVHANYAVSTVGPDFEYLLLRKVLATHRPAMVVLHVYLGNDITDIDRPYECCDMGPLLTYLPDGPQPRCPTARWGFTLASRLSRSPPPYPLRVATVWSHAARHAAATLPRLLYSLDQPPSIINGGDATEAAWVHFAQILTRMRDDVSADGAVLVVDMLPARDALESKDPDGTVVYQTRRRVAEITAALGIPTLDAWDLFAGAVARDGARKYFLPERDIHFTADGHRLVADWLQRTLPPVPDPAGGGHG